MTFKRKGEKTRYNFSDKDCIGRTCWAPGMFQHRSPLSGGGSRNTGSSDTPCCLNRAYRGCPEGPVGEKKEECSRCNATGKIDGVKCAVCNGYGKWTMVGLPEISTELIQKRKLEGWKAT